MTGGPARSAGARLRSIALAAVFCALTVGPGCGRETFDLLNTAGNAGNAGSGLVLGAGAAGEPDTFGGGGNGNEPDAGAGRAGVFGGRAGSTGSAGGNPAGCLAGEPCASSGVVCPPTVSFCEHCSSPKDCAGNSDSPYCSTSAGRCVQCQHANDCAPDEICYPFTLRCAHVCITAAQCVDDHSHPVCDPQFGVCVTCIKDSNCRPFNGHPTYCAVGSCVECDHSNDAAASTIEIQCPDDRPYCVGLRCQSKPH